MIFYKRNEPKEDIYILASKTTFKDGKTRCYINNSIEYSVDEATKFLEQKKESCIHFQWHKEVSSLAYAMLRIEFTKSKDDEGEDIWEGHPVPAAGFICNTKKEIHALDAMYISTIIQYAK